MAYNNAIPQPTDLLSQSQSDILNNFAAIQTLISVDHVNFNAADQGKHNKVTMPVQGGAPVLGAGYVGFFNLNNSNTGNNELYVQNQAGTNTPITAASASANGWTYLPSGLLIKWGHITTGGGGAQTITFPTGASIPVFNNVFVVFNSMSCSGSDPNTFAYITSWTTTNFVVFSVNRTALTNATSTFNYLAIGN